jgi:hypothetical protein
MFERGRIMKCLMSFWSACILVSLFMINPVPALAKGPAVSKAEATKIADREMDMIGYKRSEWKAHADENNAEWKKVSELRRDSASPEHQYWAVRYEHLVPPGGTKKNGDGWVFVASDSGRVLLVILPGS